MQALNRTIEIIQRQLKDFSMTARLLIGALAVILALTLMLVANITGQSEFVPLGVTAVTSPEVKTQVVSYLQSNQIPHETNGTAVLVPASRKLEILSELGRNQVLGFDQIDFDSLLDAEPNVFEDRESARRRFLVRKMNLLSQFLGLIEGVESGSVMIDKPERDPGLGRQSIRTSATVVVTPEGARVSRHLAEAVAAVVAGAEATLTADRVKVVDGSNGRVVDGDGDSSYASAAESQEMTLAYAEAIESKLTRTLDWIKGVIVTVNPQVNVGSERTQITKIDEPRVGPQRDRSREYESTAQRPSAGPGVSSNTGTAIASASGPSTNTTSNSSDSQVTSVFPSEQTTRDRPPGEAKRIDATVMIPYSWLAAVYQLQNGADADPPDSAALQAIADQELPKIEAALENLVRTDTVDGAVPGEVTVIAMADMEYLGTQGVTGFGGLGQPVETGGMLSGLAFDGIISTIGLLALSAISLMLMFMMVRRASKQEPMPSPEELVGIPPALAEAEDDLVGEVDESDAAMEGVEISEDEVRRNQMLEQINDMVRASPADAASLVRKWIRSDEPGM